MLEKIRVEDLRDGDVLAKDIYLKGQETPLVLKHSLITNYIKEVLRELSIREVVVEREDTREIHKEKFKSNYKENVSYVKSIFTDIVRGEKVDLEKIDAISGDIINGTDDIMTTVEAIDEMKLIDDITYTHSINVSLYAMMLARWLKLERRDVINLIKAGVLHDIGKTKVDTQILNKPGRLTEEEFKHIQKHTVYGYNICRPIKFLDEEVKKAVLMHHEKLDGTGYPLGLSDKNVPLFARIIGICDVYDALNSKRIYKDKQTPFDTFNQMEIFKGKLDEEVLKVFLKNVVSLYKGSRVKMNTGDEGEIIHINSTNISKPIVKISNNFYDLSKDDKFKIEEML